MENNSPPDALLMDVRERLVRIETKMDTAAKDSEAQEATTATNSQRIATLEAEAASLRHAIQTLKWVGGAAMATLSLFGDSLLRLVT